MSGKTHRVIRLAAALAVSGIAVPSYSNTVPSMVIIPAEQCNSLYKHKKISQSELDAALGLHFSVPEKPPNGDTGGINDEIQPAKRTIKLNLCYADLSGLSLNNRRIAFINFSGANLSDVNLSNANINDSVFNGAQLINTNLSGANITRSDFYSTNLHLANLSNTVIEKSIFVWSHMTNSNLTRASIRQSTFQNADFQYAHIVLASISSSDLTQCDFRYGKLQQTNIVKSNLRDSQFMQSDATKLFVTEANLYNAAFAATNLRDSYIADSNFFGANFTNARLDNTRFEHVNFSDSTWVGTVIDGTSFVDVDFYRLRFEIASMQSVPIDDFTKAKNLAYLRYETSPRALLNLRGEFKTAGLRKQEREITYAIEQSETMLLLKDEAFMKRLGGYANVVLFDLPTAWGMHPHHAFNLLFGSIIIFAIPYTLIILIPTRGAAGIWRIASDDLLQESEKNRLTLTTSPITGLHTGLYFSILSAFQIGFREYNISDWLVRLQPKQYVLLATGWVRTLVGLQSLISIFLFASWLASFARPFE